MADDFIKFLGTAGARFVMARQLRYSAGTFLSLAGQRIMLDPGPGTLLRCAKSRPRIDPATLDAVILTHAHVDHSGDLSAVLDAMTAGGFRPRGRLFAPQECLEGRDAVVLAYLRKCVEGITVLGPHADYSLGPLAFGTSCRHMHPLETYGLKLRLAGGTLAFLVDTLFFEGLIEEYAGADVLVLNVVRADTRPSTTIMHLTVEDARRIIAAVRPRKAVLTHFGMTMLEAHPREIAQKMTDELGVEVIAASDGMTIELTRHG